VEAVPDETTICRFRQRLIQCGHEQLLGLLNEQLERKGCIVKLTTLTVAATNPLNLAALTVSGNALKLPRPIKSRCRWTRRKAAFSYGSNIRDESKPYRRKIWQGSVFKGRDKPVACPYRKFARDKFGIKQQFAVS
jgi:hypothetical protein